MVEFDAFGPEKILEVYNPKIGMKGFVVLDNLSLGPSKGGIRMTPTVSIDEVAKLARIMTWKSAMANLPFGGGKSGIIANPKEFSLEKKKEIIEAFSEALKVVCPGYYIAAPDINTAEQEMEWFAKANGNKKACTGKPKKMGGIPHELGSTGFGVAHATFIALKHIKKNIKKISFAVEGFGNVGTFAAKFLTEAGAKLVAVSDSKGCIYLERGIDYDKLMKVKEETGSVINYDGKKETCQNIIRTPVDVLITAAIPDVIKAGDIDSVKAKLIVEGSNIPMTEQVEILLHKKGILVVPDFVANAGGVISSYIEYTGGGNEKKMFKLVEKKIKNNTSLVLNLARKRKTYPRAAALEIAQKRVLAKCDVCAVKF